jgi:shikimate dehydrogenase
MTPPLTTAALEGWRAEGTCLAVLGMPIAHSISPQLHHAALEALVRQGHPELSNWRYLRFEVAPETLGEALSRFHAAGFLGINLTIPHKVLATRLVVRIDPTASRMGAVNTLRRIDGGYEGFNTDGYGLATAVRETLGREFRGSPVVLLGAGGAARAAAVQALMDGCSELWIGNRSAPRLRELLTDLRAHGLAGNRRLEGFLLSDPPLLPADALVVNSTAAGLDGDQQPPLDPGILHGEPAIYDMVYKPKVTPLLDRAMALGIPCANGVPMLVHQAVKALSIWTGLEVPAGPMHAAALQAT